MEEIVVVGGGPAGIFSALKASEKYKVIIVEKNEKLGMKLGITGKGRCNITNASAKPEFLKNIIRNKNFFKKSFYQFSNQELLNFLDEMHYKYKIERGNRVFPVSDSALEFVRFLTKLIKNNPNIKVLKGEIYDIRFDSENKILFLSDGREIITKKLIIATGGKSYTKTGSTGDGYEFAKKAGHSIIPIEPVLIPMNIEKNFWLLDAHPLQLKNIALKIKKKKRTLWEEIGEMNIEYYGISGPLTLKASSLINDLNKERILLDLKPGLTNEKLTNRIYREIDNQPKGNFNQLMKKLLPSSLATAFCKNFDFNKSHISDFSPKDISKLTEILKNVELPIIGKRPLEEAIITRGGVEIKEIDGQTMESRIVNGLYFVGEILDIDALTGGYNLQIAFTTGWVAGSSI